MKIKNDLIKNLKNRKKLIILLIILVVLLITCFIIFNKEKVIKIAKRIFKSETKEITYEVTSNENNKIKITVQVTDTENGISELGLPDGDKIKTTKERTQLGVDYVLDKDGEYTFTSKSTTGEILTETIIVNNEFRNNLIGIEKIQEISTEQDYKITKKYDGNSEYKYYYAIGENNDNWIEIPEYQIVNIDEYKILENNWQNEEGQIVLKLKKVGEKGNTVEVHKKIENIQITENLYNKTEQIIEGESIIACVRDNNIKSGNYTLKVNGEEYPAEIYNYDENVNYITNKNIGTSEEDNRMLIVKYNGNLNINERRLITAQTRKKGMFIYVAGELINNGEISMTARGAKAEGQNVYLWKHDNGAYEYVPAEGGNGGKAVSVKNGSINGNVGTNGINRQTGGGGSGYAFAWGTYDSGTMQGNVPVTSSSGVGTIGTSYSGGTGGGSGRAYVTNGKPVWYEGTSGLNNGGTGGNGYYGGTGNPGGRGDNDEYIGTTGTGGLLILYSDTLNNSGKISSNGTNSNEYGGASGGGTINIFYNKLTNEGTIESVGGKGGNGGDGGNGSYVLQNITIKKPIIEVDEITQTSFRIKITNIQNKDVTYDYYVNSKIVREKVTDELINIDNLEIGKAYEVKVSANYYNEKVLSDSIWVKTLRKDNFIEEMLDYPRMTTNGMVNVKFVNPENSNDYSYELDLSKDCTAPDALDKAAYDGDATTYYDGTSEKCKFYYESNTNPYYTCFNVDSNFKGNIVEYLSGSGYWNIPSDGKFLSNNVFHTTWYGKNTVWSSDIFLKITGKLYEIFYDENIP